MFFKQHNNHPIYTLTYPVLVRAHAAFATNIHTFTDTFANGVLDKLTQTRQPQSAFTQLHAALTRNDLKHQHRQQHIQQITRCAWIDKQILTLLKQHPKAVGFEINAGLSTRFHRLSEQLDWPQFSWVGIDTPEITQHKNTIFPKDDNLFTYLNQTPLTHWHHALHQHKNKPVIILIELFDHDAIAHYKQSLHAFLASHQRGRDPVHFFITHPSDIDIHALIPKNTPFNICHTLRPTNKHPTRFMARFINALHVKQHTQHFYTTHICLPHAEDK